MSREVLELFHRMIARVYVGLGQSQGKTLLPLPPSDMLVRLPPPPPAGSPAAPRRGGTDATASPAPAWPEIGRR